MADFAFFTYNFAEATQLRTDVPNPTPIEKAQERFGMLFSPKTTLSLLAKKGDDTIQYQNTVLAMRDGIIIWRIHNEQTKDIIKPTGKYVEGIQEYESVDELSYPHSIVIIDNRPGRMYIAIEKSSAWKSKTKRVQEVICEGLTKTLQEKFGLEMSITEITIPSKIWDFCESRCKDGKDTIQNIIIGVKNPQKHARKSNTDSPNLPQIVEYTRTIAELTNALEADVSLKYTERFNDKMRESLDDVVHLIDICTQQDYTLSVEFKEYGVYKCNELVQAIFKMNDYYLKELYANQYNLLYSSDIVNWLENTYNEIAEIRNATKIPEARKRGRKK